MQATLGLDLDLSITIGDRLTVGVSFWIVEKGIKFFNQQGRLYMFKLLRYFMYFIPVKLKLLHEKGFPKPVFSNDGKRLRFSMLRHLHAIILFVRNEIFVRKLLDHVRYRGGLRVHSIRYFIGKHGFLTAV